MVVPAQSMAGKENKPFLADGRFEVTELGFYNLNGALQPPPDAVARPVKKAKRAFGLVVN